MPSGPVRLAVAGVQANKTAKKGAMSALASKLSSQESMKNAYPVKGKKK